MAGRTNKENRSWLRRHRADLLLLIAAIVVIAFAIWVILGDGRAAEPRRAAPSTTSTTPVVTPKETSGASKAPSRRPVAVFVADSYTTGVGGGGTKWTTLLAQRRGWDEVNLGYRGTGYARASIAPDCPAAGCPNYLLVVDQVVARRPDIVVVSGGRNDAVDMSAAATNIPLVFQQLRTKLPKARIIAISPFWDSRPYPVALRTIGSDVHSAMQSVRGEYVEIGSPLRNKPQLLGRNGIFPAAAGYETLANAVASALGTRRQAHSNAQ